MISPKLSCMPFIWAMNMLATETNSAVPSMLMLQPMGSTNLVILGSIFSFSFMHLKKRGGHVGRTFRGIGTHLKVMGRAAAVLAVAKAVSMPCTSPM